MYEEKIHIATRGELDIVDITEKVEEVVRNSGIKNGICLVFISGSTASVVINEDEERLLRDLKNSIRRIIPEREYEHPFNARSHLRAMLFGCEKVIPIAKGELQLGTWQQIMLVEFDTRGREREVIVKVIGS